MKWYRPARMLEAGHADTAVSAQALAGLATLAVDNPASARWGATDSALPQTEDLAYSAVPMAALARAAVEALDGYERPEPLPDWEDRERGPLQSLNTVG
jgi:hypothetical protein